MGKFDEHLWTDLLDQHGSELAAAQRATTHPGRARPAVLTAVGAFGVAGLATVLALTFTATSASPAFAVTRNADGTVTVLISQVEGIAGANALLAKWGVRAKAIVADPDCKAKPVAAEISVVGGPKAPTDPTEDKYIIEPSSIPVGDTLLLLAEQLGGGSTAIGSAQVHDPAPACYRGPLRATGPTLPAETGVTRSASASSASATPSH